MSESDDESDHPGDEIEERILDAAEQLIARYGYDKTTVDDIARKAGVSKSTLYLRWRKKDDLLETLIWRASRCYIRQWLALVDADPEGGTFRGIFRNALLATRDNAFIMMLFGGDMAVVGRFINRIDFQKAMAARSRFSQEFVTLLQDAGIVRRDLNIDAVSYTMSALRYGLLKMPEAMPSPKPPPLDDLMEVMLDMLACYMESENGGDSETGKRIIRQIMESYGSVLGQLENGG